MLVCVLGATGCGKLLGIGDFQLAGDAAQIADAPPDQAPDTPPGQFCYGSGLITVCLPAAPNAPLGISAAINTDTCSIKAQQTSGPDVCLLSMVLFFTMAIAG